MDERAEDTVHRIVMAAFSVMHHDCDPFNESDEAAIYEYNLLSEKVESILNDNAQT